MTVLSDSISIDWRLLSDSVCSPAGEKVKQAAETRQSPEHMWVKRAQGGDPEAFRVLVVAHQDRIFHLCFQWLGNSDDALEACQDVFLRAFAKLSSYRGEGKFSTWLYQIALNRCRDHRKTRWFKLGRLSDSIESVHAGVEDHREQPDKVAERQDEIAKLRRGMAAIAERHRSVLILVHVEMLSHRDCAAILKCSIRAVEGRLYRAHRELQKWWEAQPE